MQITEIVKSYGAQNAFVLCWVMLPRVPSSEVIFYEAKREYISF